MKKVLVFALALLMVLTVSVPVYAAPNGFTKSPGGNIAPGLIEYDNETEECLAQLILTAYAQRQELPEEFRLLIEKAYNDIVSSQDLTSFNAAFKSYVNSKNIASESLAVSDLFDIRMIGCDDHDEHGSFTIKIKPELLKNFVGLLHLKDGKWDFVDNAKVDADGEHLTFSVDSFSPFAIVVKTDKLPPSGDAFPWLSVAMLVVSSAALVVFLVRFRKSKV